MHFLDMINRCKYQHKVYLCLLEQLNGSESDQMVALIYPLYNQYSSVISYGGAYQPRRVCTIIIIG